MSWTWISKNIAPLTIGGFIGHLLIGEPRSDLPETLLWAAVLGAPLSYFIQSRLGLLSARLSAQKPPES